MKPEYLVRPLAAERVAQAFPLIRDAVGRVSLEEWSRFASALTAPGEPDAPERASGIVVAERQGYIRGLCTYQAQPHLGHGLVMLVHHLVVLEVVGRKAVADALLSAVDELAERQGCRALHVTLPLTSEWAVGYLRDRGHSVETHCMCRRLKAEA